MSSENSSIPSNDLVESDETVPPDRAGRDGTENGLSLFVVADEHVSRKRDVFDPVSDLTWLQFIDGLDTFLVVGTDSNFFETVARDDTSAQTGLWLVDDAGTVQQQWALPSKRREVLSIGRFVEKEIDVWGDAE